MSRGNVQATAALFADDFAASKRREAAMEQIREEEFQRSRVLEGLKSAGAKHRFKVLHQQGFLDEARIAAAVMLQGAWRMRVAAKHAEVSFA